MYQVESSKKGKALTFLTDSYSESGKALTFLTDSYSESSTRRSILGSDGMTKSDCCLALWVLWVILNSFWSQKMKIESFRQVRTGRTNGRMHIVTYWAPVGDKNEPKWVTSSQTLKCTLYLGALLHWTTELCRYRPSKSFWWIGGSCDYTFVVSVLILYFFLTWGIVQEQKM